MERRFPNVAADGVVVKEGKILLISRATEPFMGMWMLPGGMIEPGETLKQACAREVREETGLIVEPTRVIGVYDDPGRDPRWVIAVAYICRVKGGKILRHTNETKGIGFFSLKEIEKMEIGADHRKIIGDAVSLEGIK